MADKTIFDLIREHALQKKGVMPGPKPMPTPPPFLRVPPGQEMVVSPRPPLGTPVGGPAAQAMREAAAMRLPVPAGSRAMTVLPGAAEAAGASLWKRMLPRAGAMAAGGLLGTGIGAGIDLLIPTDAAPDMDSPLYPAMEQGTPAEALADRGAMVTPVTPPEKTVIPAAKAPKAKGPAEDSPADLEELKAISARQKKKVADAPMEKRVDERLGKREALKKAPQVDSLDSLNKRVEERLRTRKKMKDSGDY